MQERQISFFDKENGGSGVSKKDPIAELNELVPQFAANKEQSDSYKKLAEKDNQKIKLLMGQANLKEFVVGDRRVTYSEHYKESFIEERLIEKIKELGVEGVIKQKEYVDMDALENAIYHGQINAAALADTQERTQVITLRLYKVKEKK